MKNLKCKKIEIEIKRRSGSFLRHLLLSARHIYSDGNKSKYYNYELIERRGIDSVAVVLFYYKNNELFIGLTKQARIAKMVRGFKVRKIIKPLNNFFLLEVVAGSLEIGERTALQMKKRAKKEIYEETGFDVKLKDIFSLGKSFFASPGQSTEKIYPYGAKVEIKKKEEAVGDGSLLEKDSNKVVFYPVSKVLEMLFSHKIEDAKTEITILRLFFRLKVL